ncbi:MAG: NADH-quinone oxidoreductase subunit N [Chitinophagales bacterium]|nr:NADH-quinone oxidoreductase subunit N [Chitinophagaceae bacterium]MCB9064041.1 NADH-quinone oxidoreductase subunit N [Chitinophagales bacterium]
MKAIIAATILGIVMMFAGLFVKEKKSVVTIATLLLLVLFGVNIYDISFAENAPQSLFNNLLRVDSYALWFNMMMTGCTFLYVLLLGKHIRQVGNHVAEYFALIFFILCGIYLISTYNNLLMLFIGIEIMSIPQYILAGSDKQNMKSNEASLKYFLMGAFTTGILLMGITLLYGATGTFYITNFTFLQTASLNPLALAGILFILVAFAFKISAAPMHLWTPDVYDGSPAPFTAFMATVVKAGAFVGFLRLFHISFGTLGEHWMLVVAIITAATLLVGNITAVYQQSVKRMLAYSSIAQAGFMLFAVVSVNATAWQGMIIYAIAYSVATIGMFSVLVKMKDYTYDGFNGLAKKQPALAFFTTIFLLSLAGIPLTGGFMAKYFVLTAAVEQGNLMWLVIFALLMAAVSVYYYFRVIMAMYFKTGDAELRAEVTSTDRLLMGITCVIIILLGVVPHLFMGNL